MAMIGSPKMGPLDVALIAGEEDAPSLISGSDQLEQDGRCIAFEGQVSHLVDDEQIRSHIDRTFASRQGEGVGTPSAFRIALAGSR